MRHRPVLLTVVAFTLISLAGCGDDAPDDQAAGPAPSVAVTGASEVPIAPSATVTTAAPSASATVTADADGSTELGTVTKPGAPKSTSTGRPATSATVLTASGLGPYKVGSSQKDLKAAGLLGKIDSSAGCPDFAVVKGLSKYQTPTLVFFQGKLQYTSVTSTKVATDKGAAVGMPSADVPVRHPEGKQLDDFYGATAWFAPSGKNALLFRIEDGKVESIEAGLAEPLQFRFTDGEGC